MTYITPDGKTITGYVNVMKHFRRTGNTSDSIEYYSSIHLQVNKALRTAIKRVHPRLSDWNDIKVQGRLKNKIKQSSLKQQSNNVNNLLDLNRN